jgi:hypothetical protein
MSLFFANCQARKFLEVSPTSLDFYTVGPISQNIIISSNIAFNITKQPVDTWFSINNTSGAGNLTVSVVVAENIYDERTSQITISGEGFTKTVNIWQEGTII